MRALHCRIFARKRLAWLLAGGTANVIDKRQRLSNGTLAGSSFTNTDMAAVQSVCKPVTAANMALLANPVQTRPDLSFVMFIDGCCASASRTGAPRGRLTAGLPVQSVPALGGWGLPTAARGLFAVCQAWPAWPARRLLCSLFHSMMS